MTNPARNEIVLVHGIFTVRLMPSLRAATILERLHDGFATLFRHIEDFNTATIREIIRVSATDHAAADAYLRAIANAPLRSLIASTHRQIIDLCTGLIPTPPETAHRPKTDDRPLPWPEVYKRLYMIATGWLGWPPATAWAATPDEIALAFDGLTEKLKAIHGGADQETTTTTHEQRAANEAAGLDPELDRAGLHELKAELGMGF